MTTTGLKVEMVVVPKWGGRDDGKTFVIEEVSALKVEKWALRLWIAIKGTHGFLSDDLSKLGAVGVAIMGLNAFMSAPIAFSDLEPLLDEMLQCIRIIRDEKYPDLRTPLMENDLMEVRTIGWLRSEVLRVHTGFSFADALSAWMEMAAATAAMSQGLRST